MRWNFLAEQLLNGERARFVLTHPGTHQRACRQVDTCRNCLVARTPRVRL